MQNFIQMIITVIVFNDIYDAVWESSPSSFDK